MLHNCEDLIFLFNSLFEQTENTVLIGNGAEPLYCPADDSCSVNRIIFTRDYFASALHEIAHWCIAGKERRKYVDYGYWYYPEGRDQEQQKSFEQIEAKPQALESIFAQSAHSTFIPSLDNLSGETSLDSKSFEKAIAAQVQYFRAHGLPQRAEVFNQKLLSFYKEKP